MLQLLQPRLFTATFAVREEQRKSKTLKFCFASTFFPGTFSNWPHDSMEFCFRTPLYSVYHHKHPGQYCMPLYSKSYSVALGLSSLRFSLCFF